MQNENIKKSVVNEQGNTTRTQQDVQGQQEQNQQTHNMSPEDMARQSYSILTNVIPVVRDLTQQVEYLQLVLEDQGILEIQQLNKYIEQKRIVSEKPKQKGQPSTSKGKAEEENKESSE